MAQFDWVDFYKAFAKTILNYKDNRYSYEDFIEGFRPVSSGGFEIKKGSFYNFCKKAQYDPDRSRDGCHGSIPEGE